MSGRHYRVVGSALLLLTVLGMPRPATAQLPLDAYLSRAAAPGQPASALRKQIATLAQTPAGKRMLNDLQAAKLTNKWVELHETLQKDPAVKVLSDAGLAVVKRFVELPVYAGWMDTTLGLLQEAPDERAMQQVLERQLTELIGAMSKSDVELGTALAALIRANEQFIKARDVLLRDLHTNRFSVEYTNNRPIDKPSTSNLRVSTRTSQRPRLPS